MTAPSVEPQPRALRPAAVPDIALEECLDRVDRTLPSVQVLILCETGTLVELRPSLERLVAVRPGLRAATVYPAMPLARNREMLKAKAPHVVLGTAARVACLAKEGALVLSEARHVVLDRRALAPRNLALRRDLQLLSAQAPCAVARLDVACAAVPLPSAATGPGRMAEVAPPAAPVPKAVAAAAAGQCGEAGAAAPAGLGRCREKADDGEKHKRVRGLLDTIDFRQAIIFAGTPQAARELESALVEAGCPAIACHGKMDQTDRAEVLRRFVDFEKRILIVDDDVEGLERTRADAAIDCAQPACTEAQKARARRLPFQPGRGGVLVTLAPSDSAGAALQRAAGGQVAGAGGASCPLAG